MIKFARQNRRANSACKLMFLMLLASTTILQSCASRVPVAPGIPLPPNSPQTQVLNVTKTLHDAVDAAVRTAISLRDNKTISPADARNVENWSLSVLDLNDKMLNELGSNDSWQVQKQKLLLSLAGFKLPAVTSNQVLQSALNSVQAIIQQIQGQVQ